MSTPQCDFPCPEKMGSLAPRRPSRRPLDDGVRAIVYDDDGAVRGVELRSGVSLTADFLVLVVPFDRVGSLVPDSRGFRRDKMAEAN